MPGEIDISFNLGTSCHDTVWPKHHELVHKRETASPIVNKLRTGTAKIFYDYEKQVFSPYIKFQLYIMLVDWRSHRTRKSEG